MPSTRTVTIPNVELTLDQIVAAIRQLGPDARSLVARALMEPEIDERIVELISTLATRPPAHDISDAEIAAEVRAVCDQRGQ